MKCVNSITDEYTHILRLESGLSDIRVRFLVQVTTTKKDSSGNFPHPARSRHETMGQRFEPNPDGVVAKRFGNFINEYTHTCRLRASSTRSAWRMRTQRHTSPGEIPRTGICSALQGFRHGSGGAMFRTLFARSLGNHNYDSQQ